MENEKLIVEENESFKKDDPIIEGENTKEVETQSSEAIKETLLNEEKEPTEKDEESKIDTENDNKEKMLSQSEVNKLMGRAREEGRKSALKDLFEKLGVASGEELEEIFGRGQNYDMLKEEYENHNKASKEMYAENALLKSGVNEERWEDVKLILGGKGLEVNLDNINSLVPTHPEWVRKKVSPEEVQTMAKNIEENNPAKVKKPGILQKLGTDPSPQKNEFDEEEYARKLFGLD